MGIYLNPGNQMFQSSLDAHLFVDKSELVSFMNRRVQTVSCHVAVFRPRGFGKTVVTNMLCAYYSKGCDSRSQFEGLKVSADPDFERHLNAHDVVRLDVAQVLAYADGLSDLGPAISRELMRDLSGEWPSEVARAKARATSDEGRLFKALDLISLSKGSGFVFIIDEWDCPMREAADDTHAQRRYLDFLRDLLEGRPYVDATYMTGILPIRQCGTHSGLNFFREYSVTDPRNLAGLVGFTADEVKRLCARFGMDYNEMARWYDGYLLGAERLHIYNPNSVTCAIDSGSYSTYWTTTESYAALQTYIDMDFDGVTADLVAMLDGQRVPADVSGFSNDMNTIRSKNDMYALLTHLGYLGYNEVEASVFVPNEEIRREFRTSISEGARPQLAALVRDSRELQTRALEGDEAYVADAVRRAHNSAAGPHYYNDEQALRAAVKLAFIWSIDDYLHVDELGGGHGYADVAFIPKPASPLPPMIVELKWDKTATSALTQVRARNHPAALAGLTGECVLVGITYREGTDEHKCVIDRINL